MKEIFIVFDEEYNQVWGAFTQKKLAEEFIAKRGLNKDGGAYIVTTRLMNRNDIKGD